MSLVSEFTVKQPGLPNALGLPKVTESLEKNRATNSAVDNSKDDWLLRLGFNEGSRTCGTSTYDDSTFYFFISEPALLKITITTGIGAHARASICPSPTRVPGCAFSRT